MAQFTYTAFGAGQWGASDATLGITGYTIEDFESTTLVSGLQVGWATVYGDVTPASTLPFTFDPVAQDTAFGGAFISGVWDGSHALVNTRTNQSFVYGDVGNWGDVIFNFTTAVTSVGFSVEQMNFEARLVINGVDVGGLAALTGFPLNGAQQGYVRIDASPGNEITSLRIDNGRFAFNDGIAIDHLAFAAIPEPSTAAWWLALCAGTFGWSRLRTGGGKNQAPAAQRR